MNDCTWVYLQKLQHGAQLQNLEHGFHSYRNYNMRTTFKNYNVSIYLGIATMTHLGIVVHGIRLQKLQHGTHFQKSKHGCHSFRNHIVGPPHRNYTIGPTFCDCEQETSPPSFTAQQLKGEAVGLLMPKSSSLMCIFILCLWAASRPNFMPVRRIWLKYLSQITIWAGL